MKLLNIIFIYFFFHTTASALDSWVTSDCTTDTECMSQDSPTLPILTWSDWADAGCTEESRLKDKQFDTLCTAFEQAHPYHEEK